MSLANYDFQLEDTAFSTLGLDTETFDNGYHQSRNGLHCCSRRKSINFSDTLFDNFGEELPNELLRLDESKIFDTNLGDLDTRHPWNPLAMNGSSVRPSLHNGCGTVRRCHDHSFQYQSHSNAQMQPAGNAGCSLTMIPPSDSGYDTLEVRSPTLFSGETGESEFNLSVLSTQPNEIEFPPMNVSFGPDQQQPEFCSDSYPEPDSDRNQPEMSDPEYAKDPPYRCNKCEHDARVLEKPIFKNKSEHK